MGLMVHHVPPHIMARGQGFLAACSGFVAASVSILTGAVYARYGQGVYYLMAALAGTGALVMWTARSRLTAHQPQSEGFGG
jgi:PPP family 3-phenylpropionic acid transporter